MTDQKTYVFETPCFDGRQPFAGLTIEHPITKKRIDLLKRWLDIQVEILYLMAETEEANRTEVE